jgi:transcriptional regulator with XRE-family HTH domain
MATTDKTLELAEDLAQEQMGMRIAIARKEKKLSREELANRMGIKSGTVKLWEDGRRAPRTNQLLTLCGLLDVTTHWLLEGRVDEAMTHHGDAAYALHGRVQHMKATLEDLSRQIDELDKILDARLKDQ